MTDPGSPAGNQPQAVEHSLPRSAVDPRTEAAADSPHDTGDAPQEPHLEGTPACVPETGTKDRASRFEIAPAFQIQEVTGLAQNLDNYARSITRTQAAFLASAIPAVSIAGAFPAAGLQAAIAKIAVPPEIGLLGARLPALALKAGLAESSIPRYAFPAVRDLGFQQAISAMVKSWDHRLLGINLQLAESAAALTGSHQALFRSVSGLAAFRVSALSSLPDFATVSAGLGSLFRSWREMAVTGLGLLRDLAGAAYRAALHARQAVLNGDTGPVAWFIEVWLRMHATPRRIEAVSAALLEEGWDDGIPEDHARLLTDLRTRSARQARVLRPIWETQLNYQTIGTLDYTVTTASGASLTVADLVPDSQTTEDLVLANECEEQRLRRVLSRLRPEELLVTNIYSGGRQLTWVEAARLAGAPDPAAMGERVRRKLKRLGAEQNRRLVQAGRS